MLSIDLWANTFTQLGVGGVWEGGDCPCCKHNDFQFLEGEAGSSANALCGRNAVQLRHRQTANGIDLEEIAGRLRSHGEVRSNEFMVRADVSENGRTYQITLFADGRAIVKGTGEAAVARSVYSKYVGH